MRRFAKLYSTLTSGTSLPAAAAAVESYFLNTNEADGRWAYALLAGCKLRRIVDPKALREWVVQASGFPMWMVEACHEQSGNWSETLAKLMPEPSGVDPPALAEFMEDRVWMPARLEVKQRREVVIDCFRALNEAERMLYLKWVSASFRPAKAAREAMLNAKFVRPELPAVFLTAPPENLLFD